MAPATYVSDRTIDSHIRNLRAKFAEAGCASIVETVHGVGFRLGSGDLMAAPRVPQKWRPTLAMIVFAVLLTVLALPTAIVIWFRALDNTASAMGPHRDRRRWAWRWCITVGIAVVFSRTITGPIDALIAADARDRQGRPCGDRRARAAGDARDRDAQPELSRPGRAAGRPHGVCVVVCRACEPRAQVAGDLDPRVGRTAARCGDDARRSGSASSTTSLPTATG